MWRGSIGAGARVESRLDHASPARWQSGYAAACKAVYTGSIPVLASTYPE